MVCPTCRKQNEPGRKFCGECGSPLSQPCPSCGSPNPTNLKFCGECGAALSLDTRPSDTKRDHQWSEKEVRKVVTFVFADMSGSTALGEALDPESIRRVLTAHFDEMKRVLEHHGG
jgi:predicted amidophosphoribosyltransferase